MNTPADGNTNPQAVPQSDFTPVGPPPDDGDEAAIGNLMEAAEATEYERRTEAFHIVTGGDLPGGEGELPEGGTGA